MIIKIYAIKGRKLTGQNIIESKLFGMPFFSLVGLQEKKKTIKLRAIKSQNLFANVENYHSNLGS